MQFNRSSKRVPFSIFFILFFLVLFNNGWSQTTIVKDSANDENSTVVIPGQHFKKGRGHHFFLGKHYRPEWTTPVRFNNFYLDKEMGGLTVDKPSGSRQTMGLRLKSTNGHEYVLRSIDKDFGNGFDSIYRGTFIANTAKDQASFGYPYAAITITPMIEAAGVYHTNPRMVFVPKQKALGEYSDKYGDQLYLFEERPDDDWSDAAFFGNSKNVVGTEKLMEKVFEDNDNSVDQKAFARARLFDMLIGDWGRHADQWRWAAFKADGKTVYKPIPRDRDQSYTIFDGLLPGIATSFGPGVFLENYSPDINNIHFFNRPGRELDRQFTNELSEADWVNIAIDMQSRITYKVIEDAIKILPADVYKINGERLVKNLKGRRDRLQDFAHRYYKYLARKIEIYGTDKKEYYDINRISSEETVVTAFKVNKDGTLEKDPLYTRRILKQETKDVHIFGFKDTDVFKIRGRGGDGVKIRLLGVMPEDSIIMSGNNNKTKIFKGPSDRYDSVFQKKIYAGPIILLTPPAYKVFENDPLGLFTRPGLHVGFNVAYHPKPWRADKREAVHNIAVNYGFLRNTFNVEYVGFLPQKIGRWNIVFKGKYDNPAAENYFGTGNNSVDSSNENNIITRYYNTYSQRYFAGLALTRSIKDKHYIDFTVFYQNVDINSNPSRYIAKNESTSPVFNRNQFVGAEIGYSYLAVNDRVLPTKGINFLAAAGYVSNIKNSEAFFKARSSMAVYVPLGKYLSFATRVGGGYLTGDANYYHLNKLGGNVNLRGYKRERFYGKSSFFNNNELRLITNTRNIVFNGRVGILGFIDNGRVWQPGEVSKEWHVGYGGGIILVPFNKVSLMATYGVTNNRESHLLLKAGMFF